MYFWLKDCDIQWKFLSSLGLLLNESYRVGYIIIFAKFFFSPKKKKKCFLKLLLNKPRQRVWCQYCFLKNVRSEMVLWRGSPNFLWLKSFCQLLLFTMTFRKLLHFPYLNSFSCTVAVFVLAKRPCKDLKKASNIILVNLLSCCKTVAGSVTNAFPVYEWLSLLLKVCIAILSWPWSSLIVIYSPRRQHCFFEPARSYNVCAFLI